MLIVRKQPQTTQPRRAHPRAHPRARKVGPHARGVREGQGEDEGADSEAEEWAGCGDGGGLKLLSSSQVSGLAAFSSKLALLFVYVSL